MHCTSKDQFVSAVLYLHFILPLFHLHPLWLIVVVLVAVLVVVVGVGVVLVWALVLLLPLLAIDPTIEVRKWGPEMRIFGDWNKCAGRRVSLSFSL